jgi:hypothetical protein
MEMIGLLLSLEDKLIVQLSELINLFCHCINIIFLLYLITLYQLLQITNGRWKNVY